MHTERFGHYEVPVLERERSREQKRYEAVNPGHIYDPHLLDFSHLPKPLGRYGNWTQDPELVTASEVGDRDKVRWMLDQQSKMGTRAVFSDDGFQTQMDRRGRRIPMRPVSGGDIVTYVTSPSISIADGGVTAASVSIQALPNAISPLFAGAGAATGGTGGFWYPGRTIQYTFMGRGTTSTSPGSTVFQINVNTSQAAGGNVIGGTTSVALAASQTNITFAINGWVTCRTIGTAGALMGVAQISLGALATTNVVNLIPLSAPATAAIDTTANSALIFEVTLGATTVNFTVHMMIWQVMN